MITSLSHSVENHSASHLHPSFGCRWAYRCNCDVVTKLTECSRQNLGALLSDLGVGFGALLDESNSFMQACMQDLPNHAAQPVGDCPDGGFVAQPRQQTPEHRLKMAALLSRRRVGRLVQYPPQIFISFGGAAAVVLFGAFLLPRTGSHPG